MMNPFVMGKCLTRLRTSRRTSLLATVLTPRSSTVNRDVCSVIRTCSSRTVARGGQPSRGRGAFLFRGGVVAVQEAARAVVGADGVDRWVFLHANLHRKRAARRERTPPRQIDQTGRLPFDRDQALLALVEFRNRMQEPPGVRVLRAVEDVLHRGTLHRAPGIHDDHVVARLRDHTQVVGDQDDRHVELVLQLAREVQDLRLDGDVQRGGGLVRDQDGRVARQRHGDHDALAHAAGELVGVVAHALSRQRDLYLLQHLHGAIPGILLGQPLVQYHGVSDLLPDDHHRYYAVRRLLYY